MGDISTPKADMAQAVAVQHVSYFTWCQCARLLLGWADEAGDLRHDLYAIGLTPLDAVREIVLGCPGGATRH